MDNNAFYVLDISAIHPAVWTVQQVAAPSPSDVDDLADLRIGGLTLSPAFASKTTTYTAATTNTTNTVMAIPADANAIVEITNQGPSDDEASPVINGRAVTWKEGANTLTVKVTAQNGTASQTYTVTVTKS